MLSSTMFCFVSAMISLEERDEKTAVYLFITPLRKTGYIVARFGVPSAIAFLAAIILLPVFKLTPLSPLTILLLATGGTLQGMIVVLLLLTFSSNKLEGMAVTKLSTLPSFWIGKAILESMPLYMLLAFVLSAIWICLLFKRYLRKI